MGSKLVHDRRPALLLITLGLGCGPGRLAGDGDGDAADASEASETGTDTSTSTSTSTDTSPIPETETDTAGEDWGSAFVPETEFLCSTENGQRCSRCDPILQDCPDGEKCVPYASTGGALNANKCVPVLGEQPPGQPCVYDGTVDATDNCDMYGICWNAQEQDGQLIGECAEFCDGSNDAPVCPEQQTCLIAYENSTTVCTPPCSPLLQDCEPGLGCFFSGKIFACLVVLEGPGSACGYLNDCPGGQQCVDAELVSGCEAAGCCAAYCDLDEPICAPGSECVSLFEQGAAPPEYQDVGLCLLP